MQPTTRGPCSGSMERRFILCNSADAQVRSHLTAAAGPGGHRAAPEAEFDSPSSRSSSASGSAATSTSNPIGRPVHDGQLRAAPRGDHLRRVRAGRHGDATVCRWPQPAARLVPFENPTRYEPHNRRSTTHTPIHDGPVTAFHLGRLAGGPRPGAAGYGAVHRTVRSELGFRMCPSRSTSTI